MPGLNPLTLNETFATYSLKGLGYPQDLCFHPTLPLVSAITGDHVEIFNRETGDRLDEKLGPIPVRRLENMDRVFFSPDGQSVVIDPVTNATGTDAGGGQQDQPRRLISVPLKLTDGEKASLQRGAGAPPRSSAATPGAVKPDPPSASSLPSKAVNGGTRARRLALDTSKPLWIYNPTRHKTQNDGRQRSVEVGPKAQQILRPYSNANLTEFTFLRLMLTRAPGARKRLPQHAAAL